MASKSRDQRRPLLGQAIELALLPIHALLSPLAKQAYLSAVLLFVASFVLLFLSTTAYILFYYAYVPHAALSVPVHLQYAHPAAVPGSSSSPQCQPGCEPSGSSRQPGMHPFGTALLAPALAERQRYDVEVVLELPRSPVNTQAGNFMVDLALLAPTGGPLSSTPSQPDSANAAGAVSDEARHMVRESTGQYGEGVPGSLAAEGEAVVARARRPALLTYKSAQIDLLRMAVALPWYAFGWKREAETLEVSMLEAVEFVPVRTRNLRGGALGVPDRLRLVLEAREPLEVYGARVEVRARLSGLRWLMYKHRILSFVVFTSLFFAATMGTAVAVYGTLTVRQILKESEEHGHEDEDGDPTTIKHEPDEDEDNTFSDTPRTFPTRHGKEPLRFLGRGRPKERDEPKVKLEPDDGEELAAAVAAGPSSMQSVQTVAEADDEDNAEDYEDAGASFRDSGIGTSIEERDRAAARRRKRTSFNVQR